MPNRAYISTVVMGLILFVNALLLCEITGGIHKVFSDEPIISGDFTFHQYYSQLGAKSLREHQATWGYDPTFMAGAPFSPIFDPSNYLIELVASIFSWISIFKVTKLVFVVGLGVIPLLIFRCARNMGMNRLVAVLSSLFSLFYLWLGLPKEVFPYGMFLYVVGAVWGIYFLGWWLRFYETSSIFSLVMLVISGALLIPVHIASPFGVLSAIIFSFLVNTRRLKVRLLAGTIICALIALLCALPWLGPYFSFSEIRTSSAIDLQSLNVAHVLALLFHGQASVETLILLLAIVGFFSLRNEQPLRRWLPLVISALFLIVFYFGGNISLRIAELEPRRFAVPLYFLLSIPAGRGLGVILGKVVTFTSSRAKVLSFSVLALSFLFLCLSLATSLSKMEKIKIGLTETHQALFQWVEENTDTSGRILFEDSIHTEVFAPFGLPSGMSFIATMPFYVKREFIGGPYPWTFIKHHFADFCDGKLLGKPIGSYDEEALEEVLKTYNIKWAVSFSEEVNRRFLSSPEIFAPRGRLGVFFLWQVIIDTGGFFLAGEGEISAKLNEVAVKSAIYKNERVVIKYHWAPSLKVEPYGTIQKVDVLGDPAGFIAVSDAPPDFRIVPNYSRQWLP